MAESDRMSDIPRWLSEAFDRLDVELERPPGFDHLCELCVEHLGVDGVGVAMIVAGNPHGLGVSDEWVAAVELLQQALGEGPCVDAYATGRMVTEPRLAGAARWPMFAPAGAEQRVGAAFAFPLQIGRARLGALDLYRFEPGPLGAEAVHDALAVATVVTGTLLGAMAGARAGTLPRALDGLIDDQAVVYQAAGMVSVQMGVSIEDAHVALRAHAYAQGSTVAVVATSVVGRWLRFDP